MDYLETIKNGYIFGFIDNAIVVCCILGAGWLAVKRLEDNERSARWSTVVYSAHVGALANAASDFAGAAGDPTMWDSVIGVTVGCLTWSILLLVFNLKIHTLKEII